MDSRSTKREIKRVKYLLNINSNHLVDESFLTSRNLTDVFKNNIISYYYKRERNLKELCRTKIRDLEETYIEGSPVIGFDEPIYVVYSGLAVVVMAFINELIKEGYKPIVLFEDRDYGGYYKMEVDY